MSGAYVAKPAVVPESEAPPGWGDWPWPGPFPPGFDWRDYEWPGLPGGGGSPDYSPNAKPQIHVYPMSGLETRETDGGIESYRSKSHFCVVLTSKPKDGSVELLLVSSNTDKGNTAWGDLGWPLEFTFWDWDRPRHIYAFGENNGFLDGDVNYTITVKPTASTKVTYPDMAERKVYLISKEIVEEIAVSAYPYGIDIGYSPYPIAGDSEWWKAGPREDWVAIRLSIYEVDSGVTDLETIVNTGIEIAFREASYTHGGGVEYTGEAGGPGGLSTIARNLQQNKRYAIVTSIEIEGTYLNSSASVNRVDIYFNGYGHSLYSPVKTLENYCVYETQEGEFGYKKFFCWAQLDNSSQDDKLDKIPGIFVVEAGIQYV